MTYSCCTTIDHLKLLKELEFDSIILACTDIIAWNETELVSAKRRLTDAGMSCNALNGFCTPRLRLCGQNYDAKAVAEYAARLFPRAEELGVQYIGVGSPKSRSLQPGYDPGVAMEQWLETLRILCKAGEASSISILLEAVCTLEGNWMTTTAEALEVLRRANLPNLGIVFDTYHAWMMGEDASSLREAGPYVKLIHTAQNIGNQRHFLQWRNFAEYQIYFDELLRMGFDGEVAVEALVGDIQHELPTTRDILKALCARSAE